MVFIIVFLILSPPLIKLQILITHLLWNLQSSFFDGIAKVDMETGEYIIWGHDHHTPGEAIFVPSSADTADEDAGHLLSIVLDGDRGTSYLLCLDARTMKEVGRADCSLPVGFGFHGQHNPPIASKT